MINARQMKLAATMVASAATFAAHASGATPAQGRYDCVLIGQGACSDEGICLGNRVSRNDRNIRLIVDFGAKTASLNGITGRLVKDDGGPTVIRWDLSMIENQSVDVFVTDRYPIIQLGPAQGGGATAAFSCRKRI